MSSSSRRIAVPPTLFTRQSTRPKRSTAAAIEPLGLAGRGQVAGDVEIADPVGAPAGRDDDRALLAQLLARRTRPIPAVEPVTTQTLPVKPELHRLARLAAW